MIWNINIFCVPMLDSNKIFLKRLLPPEFQVFWYDEMYQKFHFGGQTWKTRPGWVWNFWTLALHSKSRERSPAKRSCLQSPALGQGLELGQCLLCRAESLLQSLLNQECTEKPRTKQNVKSWLPWFVCCSHLPSVTCSRDNTETEHSLVLIIFLSCSILLSCIYHPEKGGWGFVQKSSSESNSKIHNFTL